MKYDTPIMHHIELKIYSEQKNVFPFSLQQVRIPYDILDFEKIDILLIETRMSKGSSGWFFSHFFLLSGGFLSVIVGKKREIRHMKAETMCF